MKAIGSISNISRLNPSEGTALLRLWAGLAFSVAIHLGLGLWFAQAPHHQPSAPQRLDIRLVEGHTTALVAQSGYAQSQDIIPLAYPPTTLPSDDMPPWIPIPTTTDETYFAPENVEKMANVLDVEELPLPENTRMPGGAIYLKILINESGSADKIEILTSTLPESYAATVARTFYLAKFSPALIAGQPVKSWRIIEIGFDLPEPKTG